MKKLIYILLGFGFLFSFYSCEEEDIKPLPEYVAVQPASFKTGPILVANPTFTFVFKLTTFEPQSYTISTVQRDGDGWITGTTDILTEDISSLGPNATVSGTLTTADVFTNIVVNETAMIRLTLTSKKGNTTVALPWITVKITG